MSERMWIPVSEAAVAIDDIEGFWTQGRDLNESEIVTLNESIAADKATVVQKGSHRWLITLGRGFTYLVEPVTACASCGQWVSAHEIIPEHPTVHSACYDRREP